MDLTRKETAIKANNMTLWSVAGALIIVVGVVVVSNNSSQKMYKIFV